MCFIVRCINMVESHDFIAYSDWLIQNTHSFRFSEMFCQCFQSFVVSWICFETKVAHIISILSKDSIHFGNHELCMWIVMRFI